MLAALAGGYPESRYGPQDAVFHRGDPADAVFYIQQGSIQIAAVSDQGEEGVIATLGAGEFFGEACLTGQPLQVTSAIAMDHAIVFRIDKESVVRALRDQPAFADMFNAFLLSRNIQSQAALINQLPTASDKRFARTLLFLARFGKDRKMGSPKMNQEVLSTRLEAMRSRINFFMNKFRELGPSEDKNTLKEQSSHLNIARNPSDEPEAGNAPESKLGPKKPRTDR